MRMISLSTDKNRESTMKRSRVWMQFTLRSVLFFVAIAALAAAYFRTQHQLEVAQDQHAEALAVAEHYRDLLAGRPTAVRGSWTEPDAISLGPGQKSLVFLYPGVV